MYGKAEFFGDFIKAYGYLGPANFKFGQLADSAASYIDACFQVYENAARNPLSALVVGRIVKKGGDGTRLNIGQIGNGLDDIERANFGITNETSGGSVLQSVAWSIPMNDSWVMGGIHAQLDFYLASPRTAANLLDPTFGFTVTGREVLGLVTFGYAPHPDGGLKGALGEAYVCTDPGRARTATFVDYERAFAAAKKSGGFPAGVVNP